MKIKFHKKYYLSMLSGDKTQTMRIARKKLKVKENDVCTAVFPGWDKTLKIKILGVGYKQVKSINEDDVLREGCNSKREFIDELLEFYPNLDKGDRLYYYIFGVI